MLIINVGMPRSGTLWRYKLIRDLVIAAGGSDGLEIRKKFLLYPFIETPNADLNTTKIKRLLPAAVPSFLGNTYVLNSHAEPTQFAKNLLRGRRMKVIYGYRDPRDCILSILEYSQRALPQYSSVFLKMQSVEDAAKFMDIYITAWRDWTSLKETLVLRYEDMLENYETCVGDILDYLGLKISENKLNEIISAYLPQKKPQDDVRIHFQHGKANRYREKFNEEELVFLASSFGSILQKMGYEI